MALIHLVIDIAGSLVLLVSAVALLIGGRLALRGKGWDI